MSLYWTLGGMLGLDTVGGEIERLARERSLGAIALGLAAVAIKFAAGLLAVALVRRPDAPRLLVGANAVAALVLVGWGGANVLAGALVLGGAVEPSSPVDERSLRWHVFLWDAWFLVWGVLVAVRLARPARRADGALRRAC